jgi:heme exporter protein B
VLSLLAFGFLVLFLGNAVLATVNLGVFIGGLVLGAMALGSGLTLISGIAVKTNHNVGLTAVLAFPVLIPILLVLRDITFAALRGDAFSQIVGKLGLLGGITFLILGLSYLLFPYLWRE